MRKSITEMIAKFSVVALSLFCAYSFLMWAGHYVLELSRGQENVMLGAGALIAGWPLVFFVSIVIGVMIRNIGSDLIRLIVNETEAKSVIKEMNSAAKKATSVLIKMADETKRVTKEINDAAEKAKRK
ncbi:hypothetical protein ACT43E_20890 (plasmid) [Acinetobacter baumannii]